mmetsp:Transcript_10127/g.15847  ORF Transcript_10127/g.15847 Transcript_10127/m.15847 type:complete len:224 (-) Transcript_10127:577-1248(-)
MYVSSPSIARLAVIPAGKRELSDSPAMEPSMWAPSITLISISIGKPVRNANSLSIDPGSSRPPSISTMGREPSGGPIINLNSTELLAMVMQPIEQRSSSYFITTAEILVQYCPGIAVSPTITTPVFMSIETPEAEVSIMKRYEGCMGFIFITGSSIPLGWMAAAENMDPCVACTSGSTARYGENDLIPSPVSSTVTDTSKLVSAPSWQQPVSLASYVPGPGKW